MDELSRLKQRNSLKAIGSASAFLAALFVGNPNNLLMDGPGVMSGLFLIVMISCMLKLAFGDR